MKQFFNQLRDHYWQKSSGYTN